MTDKICYWDDEAEEQRERDATPEEQAEIDERRASAAANAAIEAKNIILAQIDDLERNALENRGSRELHMRLMEREAIAEAAALSTPDALVTADQVLARVPYYAKLKALDDQIATLRAQL